MLTTSVVHYTLVNIKTLESPIHQSACKRFIDKHRSKPTAHAITGSSCFENIQVQWSRSCFSFEQYAQSGCAQRRTMLHDFGALFLAAFVQLLATVQLKTWTQLKTALSGNIIQALLEAALLCLCSQQCAVQSQQTSCAASASLEAALRACAHLTASLALTGGAMLAYHS